ERDRADLLLRPRWMGGSGDARLRPTLRRNADGSASGPGVLTVVCALAVVAEVGGGYAVWRHIQQQMEQEQARAMALQRAFEDSRPWIGKPALAVWGELCARAIAEHAVDLAGWHVSQIQCDPKTRTLHVQWERGPGAQFDDLARLRPGARLRSSAQEPAVAQEQVSLRAPADSPLPVALADVPTRAAWLRQSSRWAEQWREARPQFQSAEKGGTFVPWLLASDLAPQETLRQLALPGSVLTHIEFNQRDGKAVWTVKATHYVRD
nr:type 4b pilus protein PilO2 [Burkholderiaceae bacterium]